MNRKEKTEQEIIKAWRDCERDRIIDILEEQLKIQTHINGNLMAGKYRTQGAINLATALKIAVRVGNSKEGGD